MSWFAGTEREPSRFTAGGNGNDLKIRWGFLPSGPLRTGTVRTAVQLTGVGNSVKLRATCVCESVGMSSIEFSKAFKLRGCLRAAPFLLNS